jgi:hypothetical protein
MARGLLRPSVWSRAELVSVGDHLDVKRRAIFEHRSQTSNLTGEPGWATFDQRFIDAFLQPHEVFIPMRTP